MRGMVSLSVPAPVFIYLFCYVIFNVKTKYSPGDKINVVFSVSVLHDKVNDEMLT